MVEDAANLLRQLRSNPPVGINWVNNYIGRTPELQIAQSKKYDYQRTKREDPEVITEHFRLLKNVAHKYGIQDDDIYNMDEMGFLRDDIGTAKVVTARDSPKYHIKPGDCDWMMVIECINVAKRRIPAMVVAEGNMFQNVWFDKDAGIPDDWVVAHSELDGLMIDWDIYGLQRCLTLIQSSTPKASVDFLLWMDIAATVLRYLKLTQEKTTLFRYGYPHIPRTFSNHWMLHASVQ